MIGMFSISHAGREVRGSIGHFRFFLLCVALGVGSLVGIGNFAADLSETTLHEARTLLAADLEIRLIRPFSEKEEAIFAPLKGKGVKVARVTELLAMARRPDGSSSQLVEVKAVDGGYPFYGQLGREPVKESSPVEIGSDAQGALAQEGLFLKLNLSVGETLRLGDGTLILRGILRKEPDRVAGPFSIGPRLLISQEGLRATGLIQPGSRVRYRYLLKIPPALSLEEIRTHLAEEFKEEGAKVRSFKDAQPRLERFLNNLAIYVGLVGLITLLVGGVGVAGSVRAFLSERQDSLAMLKCLGATSREIQIAYLLQILFLAVMGSFFGIVLGLGLQALLLRGASGFFPIDVPFLGGGRTIFSNLCRAGAMGVLTALLFALPPLLALRSLPPARLFRRQIDPSPSTLAWRDRGILIGGGLLLVVLIFWQAGSIRLGIWVVGVLTFAATFLGCAAFLFLKLLRRFPRKIGGLSFRQGLSNLYRPGNQTLPLTISVGIGITILLTLSQIEASLTDHLRENLPGDAPSLFFIDLQPDQKKPFETLVSGWPLSGPPRLTPLVRSRLIEIDGEKVSEMPTAHRPDGWYFTREYVLTEQKILPEHNRIIQGSWWTSAFSSQPPAPLLSVEAEAARHLGVHLGSVLTFDIQGVPISGKVASIREVDWGSFTTNFFMIFTPGALSGAPTTYVAEVRTSPQEDLPLQSAVVRSFPNVTVIPLREVLEGIARLLERMAVVIRWLARITLLAGLVVLSGALAATRYQRLREMAILKAIGSARSDLLRALAVEHLFFGALTGLVSSLLSVPLAYLVVRFLLDVPWSFHPERVIVGIAATALLTLGTGLLFTFNTLGKKPLAILRTE
jgi:putative ABC transport system permease protein